MRRLFASILLISVFALAGCDSAEERAEAAFARAMSFVETGDDARARVELRNATRENPAHFGAALELARLNMREGSQRGMYRWYLRVVELEPENFEGLRALAETSFLVRDWESFNRYGPRAIEADPNNPASRALDLVTQYRTASQDQDSPAQKSLLIKAEELSEELPENFLLQQLLIDGYLSTQRYREALETLDEAIAQALDKREFYDLKLRVLNELGDQNGISETLRGMVDIFPEDNQYKQAYVLHLIKLQRLDDAEAFLRQQIVEITAQDPLAVSPYLNLLSFQREFRGESIALAELDAMLEQRPDFHRLRLIKSNLIFTGGQQQEGIAELEDLLALDEETLDAAARQDAKVTLAKMLRTMGNDVGARRLVEEILEVNPDEAEALKLHAGWLIDADQYNEAITALRSALATAPEDAQAMSLMAVAYNRSGNIELELDFLALAADASNFSTIETLRYARTLLDNGRTDQAEATVIEALRLRPRDEAVLSFLGTLYLREDDRPRIRQVMQSLQDIGTDTAITTANGLELELISRESGQDEMISFLQELNASADSNERTRLALLQTMMQSDRTQEALDYIDGLIAEQPNNDGYRYFKALILVAMGDLDTAEQMMVDIVTNEPRSITVWQQLIRLQQSRNPEAAAATLDQALQASPNNGDLLWIQASMLESEGDIDGAITIYEEMYERFPGAPIIANNLASLLTTYRSTPENLEKAELIAQRLKNSDVPAFQDTYGWILHLSGDSDQAREYLEPAADGLPRDAVVQVHLGLVYLGLNRPEDAQNQLVRARSAAGPLTSNAIQAKIAELESAISSMDTGSKTEN